jgi:predicted membrane protein
MKKIVFGIIAVAVGIFLLLYNLGQIEEAVYPLVISWQSLLVAIGLTLFFDWKSDRDHPVAGFVLISTGVLFLLPEICDYLQITPLINIKKLIIPVLIILAGFIFIFHVSVEKKNPKWLKKHQKYCDDFEDMPFEKTSLQSGGVVKREYVFTASKEKWTYGKLRNVELEAVFSGVELDFSQAELAEDVKVAVHIKISVVFGGVVLFVPEDWNIMIQKTGVFGGFVDSRPNNREVNEDKLVIMELDSVFGGGEIKCYE